MNCAIKNHLLTDNRFHWQKESGDFVEAIDQEQAEQVETPNEE